VSEGSTLEKEGGVRVWRVEDHWMAMEGSLVRSSRSSQRDVEVEICWTWKERWRWERETIRERIGD